MFLKFCHAFVRFGMFLVKQIFSKCFLLLSFGRRISFYQWIQKLYFKNDQLIMNVGSEIMTLI